MAGGPAERPVPVRGDTGAPGDAQPPQPAAARPYEAATGTCPPRRGPSTTWSAPASCSWANRPATRSCSALSCNRGRRSPATSPHRRSNPAGSPRSDTPGYVKVALQHPGGALRQRARPDHDRDTDGGHGPREPAPLRPLLAARRPVQRADPPADTADREIRCRATTWSHQHHPPTRRVSLTARRARPGGASGSGARVPAQHTRPVPRRRPDARDCRSLPAHNAGTERRAFRRRGPATQNAERLHAHHSKDRPRCPVTTLRPPDRIVRQGRLELARPHGGQLRKAAALPCGRRQALRPARELVFTGGD